MHFNKIVFTEESLLKIRKYIKWKYRKSRENLTPRTFIKEKNA